MWWLLGGIFFGWSLGANDASHVFGPAVATRSIRFITAAITISVLVILGSLIHGVAGLNTISSFSHQSITSAFLITFSAAVAVTIMTYFKLPVSTSQALIGSIMGIGIGRKDVSFSPLIKVILCWIGTPLGAILFAYIFYFTLGYFYNRISNNVIIQDRLVKLCLFVSGAYGSYALGANNVANVTGVYVNLYIGNFKITPHIAALIGSISIAVGVLTYSRRVMETIGEDLVPLLPFTAFIAILSSAITVHIYALVGVPVSTSQAIVGAVIGMGLVKGVKTINVKVLKKILFGWLATPIISGCLSFLILYLSILLGVKI